MKFWQGSQSGGMDAPAGSPAVNDLAFNCDGFHYDPATGFIWKGEERRDYTDSPYRRVCQSGVRVTAQRLAWRLKTGDWPPSDLLVDHRDGDKHNNRWDNLRLATGSQNQFNRATVSRERGAFVDRTLNRWRVMVRGCVTVSGYASHSISAFVAARLIRKLVQGDFTTHRKSQPQKEAA